MPETRLSIDWICTRSGRKLMTSKDLSHQRNPRCAWRWVPVWLALAGMLLPLTGWPASLQLQNLCAADGSSDERENEFPGENEEGDPADRDLETHLLYRRSPRESLSAVFAGQRSTILPVEGDRARCVRTAGSERNAAACSAAPLPLRC